MSAWATPPSTGPGRVLLEAQESGSIRILTCDRSPLAAQSLFERCGVQRSGQIYNVDESDPVLADFTALTP